MKHIYLIWPENTMNTNITPVQRNSWQALRSVPCIVVFIQKTIKFIRKRTQNCLLAHLTSITMQYHFPSQCCMITQVVTSTSSQRVCDKESNLCLIPNVDMNGRKVATCRDWNLSGSALVPKVRSQRNSFACRLRTANRLISA